MISVSDADFIRTIRELGREEGLFTEPAGSVSVAALRYLVKVPVLKIRALPSATSPDMG